MLVLNVLIKMQKLVQVHILLRLTNVNLDILLKMDNVLLVDKELLNVLMKKPQLIVEIIITLIILIKYVLHVNKMH